MYLHGKRSCKILFNSCWFPSHFNALCRRKNYVSLKISISAINWSSLHCLYITLLSVYRMYATLGRLLADISWNFNSIYRNKCTKTTNLPLPFIPPSCFVGAKHWAAETNRSQYTSKLSNIWAIVSERRINNPAFLRLICLWFCPVKSQIDLLASQYQLRRMMHACRWGRSYDWSSIFMDNTIKPTTPTIYLRLLLLRADFRNTFCRSFCDLRTDM